jgi:hypothetical protein
VLNRHLVQTAQVGTDIVMAHRLGLMVLADSDTAMVHRHALMEPVGLDTVTVHLRDLMVLVDLETVMALHPVLMAQVGCGTAMVHLLDLMVLAALGTVIKRHSIPRLLISTVPLLDAVDLEFIHPQPFNVGSVRHFEARG